MPVTGTEIGSQRTRVRHITGTVCRKVAACLTKSLSSKSSEKIATSKILWKIRNSCQGYQLNVAKPKTLWFDGMQVQKEQSSHLSTRATYQGLRYIKNTRPHQTSFPSCSALTPIMASTKCSKGSFPQCLCWVIMDLSGNKLQTSDLGFLAGTTPCFKIRDFWVCLGSTASLTHIDFVSDSLPWVCLGATAMAQHP